MTKISLGKQEDGWTVFLSETFSIGGFSSEEAAGTWLLQWLGAGVAQSNADELKRQMVGAALLERPGKAMA